jgi:hypothetical protein
VGEGAAAPVELRKVARHPLFVAEHRLEVIPCGGGTQRWEDKKLAVERLDTRPGWTRRQVGSPTNDLAKPDMRNEGWWPLARRRR